MATDTKAAEEAFKEGQQVAKTRTELATTKKENELLAKGKAAAERAYNAAIERPNRVHLAIAVTTAGVGVGLGYKANELLEKKTSEWVDEETKEKTMLGKVVQHATVPVIGFGIAVWGAFQKNGAVSSAMMGGGTGLATGSIIRSALVPPAIAP